MGVSSGPTLNLGVPLSASGNVLARSLSIPENRSPIQESVDRLSSEFVERASDWGSLAALTAGGLSYRWIRGGVISRCAAPILFPAQSVSIGAALFAEAGAFELTHRSLQTFFSGASKEENLSRWSWSGSGGLKEGLLVSLLFFGVLKGSGFLAREENWVVQQGLQSSAVVAAQEAAALFGILPKNEGPAAERWIEAEAMNLQQGASLSLLFHLSPALEHWRRGRELPFGPSLKLPARSLFKIEPLGALQAEGADIPGTRPSPPLLSSFMTSQGEGGGSEDLPSLVRGAIKNKPGALDALKTLVEKGHPWGMNALREVAEKNLKGVFALIELDQKGIEGARLKLKQLDLLQLNLKSAEQGGRKEALHYLAKAGNAQAFEFLFQQSLRYHYSPSFEVILSLAKTGDSLAWAALGKIALQNPRAVEALSHLKAEGSSSAARILKTLEIKHYSTILFFSDKTEMIRPLFLAASAGNDSALTMLSRAAFSYPEAVEALSKLAKHGNDEAIASLAKVAGSKEKVSKLALEALRALATAGFQRAAQELTQFPPPLPAKPPRLSLFERLKGLGRRLRNR